MKDNPRIFLKALFLLSLGAVGLFSWQLMLELISTDYRWGTLSFLQADEARALIGTLNGKLNQVMAVVFIAVGMAVPLTANLYSLKFLEFFIKNPVNVTVLLFIIFVNLSGLWATYLFKGTAVPSLQVHLLFVLTIASLLLIFPYLFYVFRFLHPRNLLNLLEGEVMTCLEAAQSSTAGEQRQRVAETLEHIANISVRSVDRSDRNTAIEGVLCLERVARHYGAVKEMLSPGWFEADQNFFLGFSSVAVEEMTASRSWLEMKLYYQFLEILRAACPRLPELTSAVAKSLRKLGLEAASINDPGLRDLVIEYFNTFIRLAINRRDIRSLFIIFDQYRTFAEALTGGFPEEVLEIAYYFEYYGQVAREQQMPFVVEAVAYDLGTLVRYAWEKGDSNSSRLLERFLHYDQQVKPPLAGVKKAQAILASYFLHKGQPEAARLIQKNFQGLDPAMIRTVREDLLQVARPKYWEVSERRMNIDFVPGPQREKLREFLDELLARNQG